MPRLIILNKPYCDEEALPNVVNYVLGRSLCGGMAVDPEYAVEQMLLVKRLWYKTAGRQVRHFILSFEEYEAVTVNKAMEYAGQVARYYGDRFQIVYGLHLNTKHVHVHFAFNTVSYVDGRMYSEGYGDWLRFLGYVQTLFPRWEAALNVSTGR